MQDNNDLHTKDLHANIKQTEYRNCTEVNIVLYNGNEPVTEANLIKKGNEITLEMIETPSQHQRKGYGQQMYNIINNNTCQEYFKNLINGVITGCSTPAGTPLLTRNIGPLNSSGCSSAFFKNYCNQGSGNSQIPIEKQYIYKSKETKIITTDKENERLDRFANF